MHDAVEVIALAAFREPISPCVPFQEGVLVLGAALLGMWDHIAVHVFVSLHYLLWSDGAIEPHFMASNLETKRKGNSIYVLIICRLPNDLFEDL